jgi:hypothetical protein
MRSRWPSHSWWAPAHRIPSRRTPPTPSSVAPSETDTPPAVRDILDFEWLGPVDDGTYFVDADTDPSTPLRVVYDIPAEGWSNWIGRRSSVPTTGMWR